jgi:hypothetical protein
MKAKQWMRSTLGATAGGLLGSPLERKQLGHVMKPASMGFRCFSFFHPPFSFFSPPVMLSEVEDKLGFGRPGGRGIWLADGGRMRSSPSPRFIDDNSIEISIGVQRRGKRGVRSG